MTRLIAAGFRASGANVVAKTTGSRPSWIWPDGSETEIPRTGPASVREQVRVVSRAARAGADVLVLELMSIGRECLAVESRRILRPHVLALTNVRLDHLEEMGGRKEDIAGTLSAAFPDSGRVLLPQEELFPIFGETASRLRTRLLPVDERSGAGLATDLLEFEPNLRLAAAVLAAAGVAEPVALRGMSAARPDFGSLRIWRGAFGSPPRPVLCLSAFAANDPESTAAVMAKILTVPFLSGRPLAGLLCLREDRGGRTLQWIRAAEEGFFRRFVHVAVVGTPARAAGRKILKHGPAAGAFSFTGRPDPAEVMSRLAALGHEEPLVVGLGNIVGPGEAFIRYWDEVATPHGR